jgi:hypothetical protein
MPDAEVLSLRAEIERLRADKTAIYEWMREPDYVPTADWDWVRKWLDRRPLSRALEGK